jgi:hypothetical protein
MSGRRSLLIGMMAVALPLVAVWFGLAGSVQTNPPATPRQVEAVIHRKAASGRIGQPKTADAATAGAVRLTIVDAGSKSPVFCRVNVVGSDGHFYEPDEHALKPWSLHRLGNRNGKGPIRYYGWFFYCDGKCTVRVPPGKTRIEVWKGFEYSPVRIETAVRKGGTIRKRVLMKRAVDMAARGWYSGDTHIHLNRRNKSDDARALDLAAAEDIRFAHILAMNDPRTYSPTMGSQIWHQNSGLGPKSARFRTTGGGRYGIMSGQEYRCGTFGHICLVGHSRLVQADGMKTIPNNWPVFGLVADEARTLGGRSFHAHGGYEREIYADFAQQATSGVELLQFAVYRGIALEGWYHILNAGFTFPAVGASDYPYCRALGDCRTYVRLNNDALRRTGKPGPDFATWLKGAAEGMSFFTTGPLLTVTINGHGPAYHLRLPKGKHTLPVKIWMQSPVAGADEIHVIAGGRVVARRRLKPPERRGPVEWTARVPVERSTWIAVRAFAKNRRTRREDVEAHTNPIYVRVDDKPPFEADSVRWLIRKLDGRIAFHAKRKSPQREKVLQYFRKSRAVLERLLKDGRR